MSKIRGQEYLDALQGNFSLLNKCAFCDLQPIKYFTQRQSTKDAGMYVCDPCWQGHSLTAKQYIPISQRPRILTITGEVNG